MRGASNFKAWQPIQPLVRVRAFSEFAHVYSQFGLSLSSSLPGPSSHEANAHAPKNTNRQTVIITACIL